MDSKTIRFTKQNVKNYIDECILFWRKVRDNENDPNSMFAVYYIDAYQSVRVSLFGRLLSE